MIRVPRVSQQQIQEPQQSATRVLPVQDQTGQQLQQVGEGMSQLAQQVGRIEMSVDASRIKGADALLSESSRMKLQEFTAKAGRDAIDARGEALADFQRRRREIEGTLTTPRQREVFSEAAREREIRYAEVVDRHYRDQSRAYEIGESTALAESAMADYWQSGDPVYRNTALAEVERIGQIYGYGPEQQAQARSQALTKLHEGALEILIRGGDTAQAAAYLDGVEGEIAPQRRQAIRSAVDRATMADQSARIASDMIQAMTTQRAEPTAQVEAGGDLFEVSTWQGELENAGRAPTQLVQGPPITRPTFVVEAAAALDAQVKAGSMSAPMADAVLERIQKRHRLERESYADEGKEALLAAEQWLMADPMRSVQDMAIAEPRLHSLLMQRGQIPTLNSFVDSDRRYATDPEALMRARAATPEQLRAMSPNELFVAFRGRLSTPELSRLMAEQAKSKGEATPADTWLLSKSARLERLARTPAFGLLPVNPAADKDIPPERRKRYEDWLLGVEQTLKVSGVKEGDREAFDAVLSKLSADVVNYGASFFSSGQPRAVSALADDQLPEAELMTPGGPVVWGTIPQDQVKDITDFYRVVHGKVATAQDIAERWDYRGRPKQ